MSSTPHPEPPAEPAAPAPRRRRLRALLRWTWRIGAPLYFLVALSILVLRHAVLPEIDRYRPELAAALSQAMGRPVAIAAIDAEWQGLRPRLAIHGLAIHDDDGRPALALDEVQAELSWLSLLDWRLHLARLELSGPRLDLRRDAAGRLFVAGLAMDSGERGGGLSDWLLAQREIVIRDATLTWTDASRQAPPLELRRVSLRIENRGRRHRFAVTAVPPAGLASRLDLRGDFRGRSLAELGDWYGKAYAELDYADLAVWRQWLDYPVDLPRGSGGLRLWLAVDASRLESFTADIALADVAVRLAPRLPMLELESLAGRIAAQLPGDGLEVSTRRLALATREGIRIEPTTLRLRLTEARGPAAARGDLSADRIDLTALNRLAAFLPLDAALRERLEAYAPRGTLADLRLTWDGAEGLPERFSVKARAARLGVNAHGHLPGVDGLTGTIDGSERGGVVTLASTRAVLEMPHVFPDPRLALDELGGELSWKRVDGAVEVELHNLAFHNADASGSASGRWRTRPDGPGLIDLDARLTRAAGGAVWRYMPLAVNARVRDWLRGAVVGGRSEEARLRLKGDLKDWPFTRERGGTFLVTGRFSGVTLRYGEGWPEINDISGELRFEGTHMLISARKGRIFDVGVSEVAAEIPDLNSWEELLLVKGVANGPTAGFLRFIEASPVAARINHFTEGMKASGPGSLQLKLVMPLRKLEDTRVDGSFRFLNNVVEPDPALPPLTEANGTLQFTGASLTARNIAARLLGEPLSLNASTRGDGLVQIGVQGGASAAALRRHFDLPLLDQLAGTTTWRGNLTVRGKRVDLAIESALQGIASRLPEPFGKSASDSLALKIERSTGAAEGSPAAAAGRETWRASLGSLASLTLLRRREGAATVVEKGVLGVGLRPELPASGVLVAVDVRRLDLDRWRRVAAAAGEGGGALPVTALFVRAQELSAFGQSLAEVELRAGQQDGVWLGQLASREMTGELLWRSQGKGRLRARLKQLALAEVKAEPALPAEPGEAVRELPALDVVSESFSLRGKALGRLELLAVNRGDTWRIDRLSLVNPDASFTAEGQWRPGGTPAVPSVTNLDFNLETGDVGKLLDRLGYANAVRRGTARLTGKVRWNGAPAAIDYPSLDGSLAVEAANGQFNKLEPGVGRLLAILSLQALPRRITLDFRDIFSEGFAFDSISGSIEAKRGLLQTQNLQIQGPAAKILMRGTADLAAETQDLNVRVRPAIGESVAVGTALVNPVVGVATLLAQKLLRDPLDQIFSYEYAVRGSWSDPKVEKVAAKPAEPAQ